MYRVQTIRKKETSQLNKNNVEKKTLFYNIQSLRYFFSFASSPAVYVCDDYLLKQREKERNKRSRI